MPHYLVVFARVHDEFRIPELNSISELGGFSYAVAEAPGALDSTRPYMVLELAEESHARKLAKRCILVKSVYEFYGQGSTYEELHNANRNNRPLWEKFVNATSFKFLVTSFQHKIPQKRQLEVIESFSYMEFQGKINLKDPEIKLACFEEYDNLHSLTCKKYDADGDFRQVYFGRLIEEGSARCLIGVFDVKKREYYGNTSMDSELSLLMANQTLASPGKLIYDPFMGTGSMAYPTAYFGAFVYGSDIDGRQMKGKKGAPGILRAAEQYSVAPRILDLFTCDITHYPWRCGELFDAIVTDPPYGVRAGAKRLGRKRELSEKKKIICAKPRNDDQPYIPSTKPYELSHLAADLVLLARYLLKPGGRLVFFLPTVTDEYEAVDICTMLCEGMEVIANSLQNFGSWGRRLVTIRKTTLEKYPPPSFDSKESSEDANHVPAHRDFREKYFQGFKKRNTVDPKQ